MTQSPQSGRATARSGLRMDADVFIAFPKIPYGGFSPIRLQGRYVRQGLPLRRMPIASIGWPPPFVLSAGGVGIPVLCRGAAARLSTSVASGLGRSTPGALAPVWVLLSRSILTYSAPSAPLAGASRFHRWAAYTRCLRCASPPRRPASGSVLSLCVPSRHAVLCDRGEFIGCSCSVPSPTTLAFAVSPTGSALPSLPSSASDGRVNFAASPVRCCYGLSSCLPPGGSDRACRPADEGFYSRAFGGSVTLPVVGYNYGGN